MLIATGAAPCLPHGSVDRYVMQVRIDAALLLSSEHLHNRSRAEALNSHEQVAEGACTQQPRAGR